MKHRKLIILAMTVITGSLSSQNAGNHNPEFKVSDTFLGGEPYIFIGEDDDQVFPHRTPVELKYREEAPEGGRTGITTLTWSSGGDKVDSYNFKPEGGEDGSIGVIDGDGQGNGEKDGGDDRKWTWNGDAEQQNYDGKIIYLQGKTAASSGDPATLKAFHKEKPDDPEEDAFEREFTLLKVDVENLREQIITDAFEVSNKVTDQYLDAQASPTGDPRTYRVKLSLDLGSSAKIRFDLYDEDGASVDRNETEEPENGELQITEKTENAETFYATDNFRFVTWDTDDGHAGNQTIKVKLGDTVRMTLVVDNDLAYFDLPVGLPPSESSTKAIRTVDTRFIKLDYNNGAIVSDTNVTTTIERKNQVWAQGAVRFENIEEVEKEPVKNMFVIKGTATGDGNIGLVAETVSGGSTEFVQISESFSHTPENENAYYFAQLIAESINTASGRDVATAHNTFLRSIKDGISSTPSAYAHVLIDKGEEVIYQNAVIINNGIPGVSVSIPDSGLSSGHAEHLHDIAMLALNYGDGNENTMDVFVVDHITRDDKEPDGVALPHWFLSGDEGSSPIAGGYCIRVSKVKDDASNLFMAAHEAGHVLLNYEHWDYPGELMHTYVDGSDSLGATKRIDYDLLLKLRDPSNPHFEMLQQK